MPDKPTFKAWLKDFTSTTRGKLIASLTVAFLALGIVAEIIGIEKLYYDMRASWAQSEAMTSTMPTSSSIRFNERRRMIDAQDSASDELKTRMLAALQSAAENAEQRSPGKAVRAYIDVAWQAYLNHDFTAALAAADHALTLEPNHFGAQLARAHALMFLNRKDEAFALYLSNRHGHDSDDYTKYDWDSDVAGDFKNFRYAGLKNQLMGDVETALAIKDR